jgi:agmatinase
MPFPYLSQNTFLKVPAGDLARPFAVAGIAWDGSVTNRPGARFAPDTIRRASHMLCDGEHPHFIVSPWAKTTDLGDLDLPNTSLTQMRTALAKAVPPLIARQHMVWLGGDHSITLPLLRCYRAHYGEPLSLIHFDAHCDTWSDHFTEPSGHGTWTYEAIQEGLVDPQATVQIGIRSGGEKATREYVQDQGGRIFTARALRGRDGAALNEVIAEIVTRCRPPGSIRPVYLTLDIDCLDPAFAPGTGTPEPGGLTSSQVLTLLEGLAAIPFVGMDCVEVSPPYDHAELASQAAANFVWTYLSGQIAHHYCAG